MCAFIILMTLQLLEQVMFCQDFLKSYIEISNILFKY